VRTPHITHNTPIHHLDHSTKVKNREKKRRREVYAVNCIDNKEISMRRRR
jgi:hypothetical protein